jgi:cytochrome c oxidase subunit II
MLPPATTDAALIKSLYDAVYVFAVITFIFVEGLLLVTALKFRRQSANEAPVQVHGNNTAELVWTIIPAIVVAIVFFMAMDVNGRLLGRGTEQNPIAMVHAIGDRASEVRVRDAAEVDLVVEVTGRQWFWQYTYKGDKEITWDSNNDQPLKLPAGKRIRLELTAADVIHAWWVPQFGPMNYVNPTEKSYIFIDNVAPGKYAGQCNVYCGVRHAYMQNNVEVLPEAEFDAWLNEQAVVQGVAGSAPVQAGDPARGKAIFMGEGAGSQVCWTCHSIDGTKAVAKVAPRTLNGFTAYPTIAQVDGFENNPENLKKWLSNPQAVKPGTAMPNLLLKPQQIEDLIAYLATLK